MSSKIVGIIPARMASSRLPGKPLVKICGIPMVGHVYLRSKMCKLLSDVYIATCDQEIVDYAESIGAKAIMTNICHQRASERTAEAILKIEDQTKDVVDLVVMIQGDEPMVFPQMIEEAIKPLLDNKNIKITNLMAPLKSQQEHENSNIVKVVVNNNNFALYFSREAIPSRKKALGIIPMYKQVPIITFRRDFLVKFNQLKPTPLEEVESVDMLRLLEHGYSVKMVLTKFDTYGVDTAEDLKMVERLMVSDNLKSYYVT